MPLFAKEQVFLVTGASSGIGQGVALKLNQEGATVVAIARRADKLEETKAQASAPEKFFCEVKDLAEDIADLPKYLKGLKDKYGKAILAQETATKKTQDISAQIEKIENELHAEEAAELDKACAVKNLSYREIAKFLMKIPEDMTLTDILNMLS